MVLSVWFDARPRCLTRAGRRVDAELDPVLLRSGLPAHREPELRGTPVRAEPAGEAARAGGRAAAPEARERERRRASRGRRPRRDERAAGLLGDGRALSSERPSGGGDLRAPARGLPRQDAVSSKACARCSTSARAAASRARSTRRASASSPATTRPACWPATRRATASAARRPRCRSRTRAFDVVSCWELLHHLDDPVAALREMWRVTARRLVVFEPNRINPGHIVLGLTRAEERQSLLFSPGHLRRLVRAATGRDGAARALRPAVPERDPAAARASARPPALSRARGRDLAAARRWRRTEAPRRHRPRPASAASASSSQPSPTWSWRCSCCAASCRRRARLLPYPALLDWSSSRRMDLAGLDHSDQSMVVSVVTRNAAILTSAALEAVLGRRPVLPDAARVHARRAHVRHQLPRRAAATCHARSAPQLQRGAGPDAVDPGADHVRAVAALHAQRRRRRSSPACCSCWCRAASSTRRTRTCTATSGSRWCVLFLHRAVRLRSAGADALLFALFVEPRGVREPVPAAVVQPDRAGLRQRPRGAAPAAAARRCCRRSPSRARSSCSPPGWFSARTSRRATPGSCSRGAPRC